MEIKIVEQKKNKVKLELHGVDHTFCNALKAQLWKDSKVLNAGYRIDHPLTGIPTMIVETESGDPVEVLVSSAQKLNKDYDKFKKFLAK